MSTKNSFKELEKELEQEFASKKDKTKEEVKGSINNLTFIGTIVELYITKFLGAIIGSKANTKNDQ